MTYTFCVPCLLGVEGLVADELKFKGFQGVRSENGRVYFEGSMAEGARANVHVRCGERVLLRVAAFHAFTFDDLFEGVKAVDWKNYLAADSAFPVAGHCVNSQLHSVPDCQRIIKKAMVEKMKEAYSLSWFEETGVKYQVRFSLMNDEAELYLDTTGAPLFKRGYRLATQEAPMRETLAASLVKITRYRGREELIDPFCGSGTIAIEAALIAKNRAPGLNRAFSAQKWRWLDSGLWLQAAGEAMDGEYDGAYDIWGGDIDPKAVAIARANAEKADVEDVVRFEVADAAAFRRDAPYGRVVTNPPYGERILEKREAEELYRAFGRAVRTLPEGWRVSVLSSHTEFERTFGRTADKKRKLYNGMLKCDLFQYGR